MRAAHLEEVLRAGVAPSDEPVTDCAPNCPDGDSPTPPCSRPNTMT
jgi:hypothetical protein